MADSNESIFKDGIRFFTSIFLSWIWYNILLYTQSYMPSLSGIGFFSLLLFGISFLFLVIADFGSINDLLKVCTWIFASIFFSWIWFNILLYIQSYIPGLSGIGFDSLLIIGGLTIFYLLKKAFQF